MLANDATSGKNKNEITGGSIFILKNILKNILQLSI
jgi:hypothetical protein